MTDDTNTQGGEPGAGKRPPGRPRKDGTPPKPRPTAEQVIRAVEELVAGGKTSPFEIVSLTPGGRGVSGLRSFLYRNGRSDLAAYLAPEKAARRRGGGVPAAAAVADRFGKEWKVLARQFPGKPLPCVQARDIFDAAVDKPGAEGREAIVTAIEECRGCPIQQACKEYADGAGEQGVWGGVFRPTF